MRSIGLFDGWLRGAVVSFKYHGEWARAEHLGALVATAASDLTPADAVIPVPLHSSRLRQRGFNQSMLVARNMAAQLGLPVEEALVRTRRTEVQAQLGARARQGNVSGAFSLAPNVIAADRSYILVDDVVTTGSTLAACTEALLHAGAARVDVATVAREL
jgi:ComF family protein